ncbi:MAG: nicotinate-nucleotide adenylyltransferase [Gammaproteobacteria bacterium]
MPALVARRPIGVFGGTFDPIHFGHLCLAHELAQHLSLGEVRFVPTGLPPHRGAPASSPRHRLAMVRLAITGNPQFVIDEREVLRKGPCYTFDTLSELRTELGAARPLCLLMGSDAFSGLVTWKNWRGLFDLAHIAVAHRAGFVRKTWERLLPAALRREMRKRLTADNAMLCAQPHGSIFLQPITALDISASTIRARLKARVSSPRYLLPDAVLEYSRQHRLFR